MKIAVELTDVDLRQLVLAELTNRIDVPFQPHDVKIEVKSKQNYKSEWEPAEFRARIEVNIIEVNK